MNMNKLPRYSKSMQKYSASNFDFYMLDDMHRAFSYGHWCFYRKYILNGGHEFCVFNTYPFSRTTIRHQKLAKLVIEEHNLEIDFNLKFTKLAMGRDIVDLIEVFEDEIKEAQDKIWSLDHEKTARKIQSTKDKLQAEIDSIHTHVRTCTQLLEGLEKESENL